MDFILLTIALIVNLLITCVHVNTYLIIWFARCFIQNMDYLLFIFLDRYWSSIFHKGIYLSLPSASTSEDALKWLQNELKGTDCGLEWLLKPYEMPEGKQVPSMEKILHSDAFKSSADKIGHLLNSMTLTLKEVVDVEEATRAQATRSHEATRASCEQECELGHQPW